MLQYVEYYKYVYKIDSSIQKQREINCLIELCINFFLSKQFMTGISSGPIDT